LPRSRKAPTFVRELPLEDDGEQTQARILVVEDNQEIGEFGAQLLQELGYATAWASDAAAALERLASDPDDFDLVFTDIVMPGGMNGIELARAIRNRYRRLPVVLTSGYSDALVQGEGSEFPLLRKPYSAESLSHLIRQSLRTAQRKGSVQ
jgi:CheY-like chemotaxis protein